MDLTYQQVQNDPVIDYTDGQKAPSLETDSSITIRNNKKELVFIDLKQPFDHVYRPGEKLHGNIRVDPILLSTTRNHQQAIRIDIHLACSFHLSQSSKLNLQDTDGHKKKQSVFKVTMSPVWILPEDSHETSFSFMIPLDLPAYNADDESIGGKIEYKVKAIYEMTNLPPSIYPKASASILISAQISTADPLYTTPMQSEKEMLMTIPRDIALRNATTLRKGGNGLVSAVLCIPHSCFLPGDSIPFSLTVHHIAPIKQSEGIHILLERVTTITTPSEEKRDTTMVQRVILPLLCNLDDHSASVHSQQQLKVPTNVSPTVETNKMIPLSVHYRIKALINMDMQQLIEDVPQRKRDRAYTMMTKMMMLDAASRPAFFYNTTIELDLPITIGTTHEVIAPPQDQQRRLLHPLQVLPRPSSCLMIKSPDQYTSTNQRPLSANGGMGRLYSDPSWNKTSLVYQEQQGDVKSRTFSSTYFSHVPPPSLLDDYDRPPSAPPLTELLDHHHHHHHIISPPPYI